MHGSIKRPTINVVAPELTTCFSPSPSHAHRAHSRCAVELTDFNPKPHFEDALPAFILHRSATPAPVVRQSPHLEEAASACSPTVTQSSSSSSASPQLTPPPAPTEKEVRKASYEDWTLLLKTQERDLDIPFSSTKRDQLVDHDVAVFLCKRGQHTDSLKDINKGVSALLKLVHLNLSEAIESIFEIAESLARSGNKTYIMRGRDILVTLQDIEQWEIQERAALRLLDVGGSNAKTIQLAKGSTNPMAALFCGLLHFRRREYRHAEMYLRRAANQGNERAKAELKTVQALLGMKKS